MFNVANRVITRQHFHLGGWQFRLLARGIPNSRCYCSYDVVHSDMASVKKVTVAAEMVPE